MTINGYLVVITVDPVTGIITVTLPTVYLVPDQPVSIDFAPNTALETIISVVTAYTS